MASTSTLIPGRSVSSSSQRSLQRPSLNPNALNTSTHSLTPLGSSDSASSSSLPQRNSSTSSQSSTASIPARPIRPPPIETRTKASDPEQVWGAPSLRDALVPPSARRYDSGGYSSPSSGSTSPALHERSLPAPPRSNNTGFVVTAGRRGSASTTGSVSGNSTSTAATATGGSPTAPRRNSGATVGMPIGPNCFRFGAELGRGSFSVVRQATLVTNSTAYAIKILDKHHLRQHKKERYATVEVEALKRLSAPAAASPTSASGAASRPPMPRKKSAQAMLPNSPSDRTIRASSSPSRGSLDGAGLMERQQEVQKGKQKARGGHPGVIKLTWAFQDMGSLCESRAPGLLTEPLCRGR